MPSNAAVLSSVRALAAAGGARALRQAAGLSLAEVARECGVTAVSVLRWETGERRPRGEPALRYARLLEELSHGPVRFGRERRAVAR